MGRTVRAFIAVPLPAELRGALAALQQRLRPRFPGVRWVAPETLHLTLCFLGDVAEEVLEKLPKVMLSVAGCHEPFPAQVGGLGAFPSPQRARVLWVALDGGAALPALQRALARGVAQLGLPLEGRPFHPHLTLGRCREGVVSTRELPAPDRDGDDGRFPIDRIVLYESRLAPSGARHLPRAIVPLGGRGDGGGGTHIQTGG